MASRDRVELPHGSDRRPKTTRLRDVPRRCRCDAPIVVVDVTCGRRSRDPSGAQERRAELLGELDAQRSRIAEAIDCIDALRDIACHAQIATPTGSDVVTASMLAYSSAALRACDNELGAFVAELEASREHQTRTR